MPGACAGGHPWGTEDIWLRAPGANGREFWEEESGVLGRAMPIVQVHRAARPRSHRSTWPLARAGWAAGWGRSGLGTLGQSLLRSLRDTGCSWGSTSRGARPPPRFQIPKKCGVSELLPRQVWSEGDITLRKIILVFQLENMIYAIRLFSFSLSRVGRNRHFCRGSWKLWLLPGCPYEKNIPPVGKNNLNSLG